MTTGDGIREILAVMRRCCTAPALDDGVRVWSHAVLLHVAGGIAARLDGMPGCGRAAPVAVLAGRGIVQAAADLALLATGRVLVPLSPVWPPARRAAVLHAAGCRAVITDAAAGMQDLGHLPVLPVDPNSHFPDARLHADTALNGLAYVITTSGTTGAPKPVAITQDNLDAFLAAAGPLLALRPDDRVAGCADPGFDVALGELLLTLGAGACLCPPSMTDLLNPRGFVTARGITVWSSVPSVAANAAALGGLGPDSLEGLRLSVFCGEALGIALAHVWQQAAPRGLVLNTYGPAEATIFATSHVFEPEHDHGPTVPIGTPIAGMRCRLTPAEEGDDTSELWLSGTQVFAGYGLPPEGTVDGPLVELDAQRWYRTGDLATPQTDGALVWCGRSDRMIKLRGYRTELAEIEAAVQRAAGAVAAYAFPETDRWGRVRSVVVVHNGRVGASAILAACADALPRPMIPRKLIALDALPLASSGKIDRMALAALVADRPDPAPAAICAEHGHD